MKSISGDIFQTQEEIDWLLELTMQIERVCSRASVDDTAVNMRDLSRFLRVYKQALAGNATSLQSVLYAFNCTYLLKEGVTNGKR